MKLSGVCKKNTSCAFPGHNRRYRSDHEEIECYVGEAKGEDKFFLMSAKGEPLSDKNLWGLAPKAVWWDADDLKEINFKNQLFKYKVDTQLQVEGKVIMAADIIGDWREEIITGVPGGIENLFYQYSCSY